MSYSRSNWVFPNTNHSSIALFPLIATVTFIKAFETVTEHVPPPPPLFPNQPYDFLYPLYIEGNTAPRAVPLWLLPLVAALLMPVYA